MQTSGTAACASKAYCSNEGRRPINRCTVRMASQASPGRPAARWILAALACSRAASTRATLGSNRVASADQSPHRILARELQGPGRAGLDRGPIPDLAGRATR